ncbi:MAG: hypothetical protein OHK93_006760 [Ramalina farinacea]|uniref:Sugar phosphate transporter domain-containing protein n=1 Tax=Ramalina farinacea TaxID=258253 RepID=A0AA43QNF3_9LECA|nr:hypothetical protein [Ramalina farinacea]
MTDPEKKERLSPEYMRSGPSSPTAPVLPTVNPSVEKTVHESPANKIHPAFYVMYVLAKTHFLSYFKTDCTDERHLQHMDHFELYNHPLQQMDPRHSQISAIVPIGAAFSLSLICGNLTYLYLSVAFIQMLKACTPVAVLLAGWAMGVQKPDIKVLLNVSVIVVGVIIASIGEIKFVLIGVLFQIGGIIFEAIRLVMVERLLSSAEYKMDPLVSLYYFAPVCAFMNFCVALVFELPRIQLEEVYHVGLWNLFGNGCLAFALNVSVVFLIGRTSGLVMTLCGVLKDILLVAASIAIWHTVISPLQYFGYSVALCGLVYYKLGGATIKSKLADANMSWAEYGVKHPIQRKLIVLGITMGFFVTLMFGLAPTIGYDPNMIRDAIKSKAKTDVN